MRKQKQSTKQSTPIQLSFNKKSHSTNMKIKQQELFAPYKIEWKTNVINDSDKAFYGANNNQFSGPYIKQPFKNVQNNTGSRVFYQNMKNELLNIKQDVQKLMMKEKTKDKSHHPLGNTNNESLSSRKNDSHNTEAENSSGNSCVRTVSIKNKCQQQPKMSRVESLYENVNSVLGGRVGYVDFKGQQQQHNISQAIKSKTDTISNNLFQKPYYQSQKDPYTRIKSKSIADNGPLISKGIYYIDLTPQKDVAQHQNQPSQQQQSSQFTKPSTVISSSSKPKLQVNIDLSLFDKSKQQQKTTDKQKQLLLLNNKLNLKLSELQKELQQKNVKLSKQSQQNSALNKQLAQLTSNLSQSLQKNTQLQKFKAWHFTEMNNLHNISLQQNNKINFLQIELQKALSFIRQKEQQNAQLIQNVNEQNNTILQLGVTCEQLGREVRLARESSNASCLGEDKKLKEKLKLKQNQLYIYQQELKEAKMKIKELKQLLQQQTHYQQQQSKQQSKQPQQQNTINQQEELIDQTQQLKWQIKQHAKIADALKSQNERLKAQIQSIRQLNSQTQQMLNQIVKQNTHLTHRISTLQKDSQKAFQQMLNTQGFQNIGQEISRKLSAMVDENYGLKNRISHLESTLEQVTLKNRSLSQEVRIYQEKVNLQKDCVRRLKIEDWDNLTQERDRLKVQVERVQVRLEETKEFYEIDLMKKENCIFELKMQINQMLQQVTLNEQDMYHPNIKSVKHIKNLDSLLKGFKQMIDENISLKEEVTMIKKSLLE